MSIFYPIDAFEVHIDGKLVYSKLKEGQFPKQKEVCMLTSHCRWEKPYGYVNCAKVDLFNNVKVFEIGPFILAKLVTLDQPSTVFWAHLLIIKRVHLIHMFMI